MNTERINQIFGDEFLLWLHDKHSKEFVEAINQTFTDLFRWASMVGNVLGVHSVLIFILILSNAFLAVWVIKKR